MENREPPVGEALSISAEVVVRRAGDEETIDFSRRAWWTANRMKLEDGTSKSISVTLRDGTSITITDAVFGQVVSMVSCQGWYAWNSDWSVSEFIRYNVDLAESVANYAIGIECRCFDPEKLNAIPVPLFRDSPGTIAILTNMVKKYGVRLFSCTEPYPGCVLYFRVRMKGDSPEAIAWDQAMSDAIDDF